MAKVALEFLSGILYGSRSRVLECLYVSYLLSRNFNTNRLVPHINLEGRSNITKAEYHATSDRFLVPLLEREKNTKYFIVI